MTGRPDLDRLLPLTPTGSTPVGRKMSDILHDLRYSVRMLMKNPVFTVAAVTDPGAGYRPERRHLLRGGRHPPQAAPRGRRAGAPGSALPGLAGHGVRLQLHPSLPGRPRPLRRCLRERRRVVFLLHVPGRRRPERANPGPPGERQLLPDLRRDAGARPRRSFPGRKTGAPAPTRWPSWATASGSRASGPTRPWSVAP